jgi:hypothetical protein
LNTFTDPPVYNPAMHYPSNYNSITHPPLTCTNTQHLSYLTTCFPSMHNSNNSSIHPPIPYNTITNPVLFYNSARPPSTYGENTQNIHPLIYRQSYFDNLDN